MPFSLVTGVWSGELAVGLAREPIGTLDPQARPKDLDVDPRVGLEGALDQQRMGLRGFEVRHRRLACAWSWGRALRYARLSGFRLSGPRDPHGIVALYQQGREVVSEYGLVPEETRVEAVRELAALGLPVGTPKEMKMESVPKSEDLLP